MADPQSIPTPEEILACNDIIFQDERKEGSSKVVRIGKYAVKYGGRTSFHEARNLEFLASYPHLAVPKCYGHGYLPLDDGFGEQTQYIITDYIEGQTLAEAFPTLSPIDKKEVLRLVHEQVTQYRNIPDPGYLGSVGNKPYIHNLFMMFPAGNPKDKAEYSGPFATYHDFVESLMERARTKKDDERYIPTTEIICNMARKVLRNHRSVWTHADLAPKNIMLTKLGTNPDDGSGIFRVTVIDWEIAGFYPEWWEYVESPIFFGLEAPWWSYELEKVVQPYYDEFWVYMYYYTWLR